MNGWRIGINGITTKRTQRIVGQQIPPGLFLEQVMLYEAAPGGDIRVISRYLHGWNSVRIPAHPARSVFVAPSHPKGLSSFHVNAQVFSGKAERSIEFVSRRNQ